MPALEKAPAKPPLLLEVTPRRFAWFGAPCVAHPEAHPSSLDRALVCPETLGCRDARLGGVHFARKRLGRPFISAAGDTYYAGLESSWRLNAWRYRSNAGRSWAEGRRAASCGSAPLAMRSTASSRSTSLRPLCRTTAMMRPLPAAQIAFRRVMSSPCDMPPDGVVVATVPLCVAGSALVAVLGAHSHFHSQRARPSRSLRPAAVQPCSSSRPRYASGTNPSRTCPDAAIRSCLLLGSSHAG